MDHLKQNNNVPIFICQNKIIVVSSAKTILNNIMELQTALTVCNYNWVYPSTHILKGGIDKFKIKIQISAYEYDQLIDYVANDLFDQKLKKKNFTTFQQIEELTEQVDTKLKQFEKPNKRNWKFVIEFIWKNGSSKKFVEETENLIRFLTE